MSRTYCFSSFVIKETFLVSLEEISDENPGEMLQMLIHFRINVMQGSLNPRSRKNL